MAGWAVLPVELLQRIAAHGDVLPMRLVCGEWAKHLAECVVSASLGIACEEADATPTSQGLTTPVVEDVQRLSVFGRMRKLDISQLPGTHQFPLFYSDCFITRLGYCGTVSLDAALQLSMEPCMCLQPLRLLWHTSPP